MQNSFMPGDFNDFGHNHTPFLPWQFQVIQSRWIFCLLPVKVEETHPSKRSQVHLLENLLHKKRRNGLGLAASLRGCQTDKLIADHDSFGPTNAFDLGIQFELGQVDITQGASP